MPSPKRLTLLLVAAAALCAAGRAAAPLWTLPAAHNGVNVVALGDSNTWLGGDDCTGDEGWTRWFDHCYKPLSCRSYARSGCTWTNTDSTRLDLLENIAVLGDNNVIYNQVMRLISDCDSLLQPEPQLVIIAAGINDAWFAGKRPHAFDFKPTITVRVDTTAIAARQPNTLLTLAEAVTANCLLLRQRFPQAAIVLVTPAQATVVGDERVSRVGDIIEYAAMPLRVPTIRLDKLSPVRAASERRRHFFTSDGTHTNAAGARRHGEIIAGCIAGLEPL